MIEPYLWNGEVINKEFQLEDIFMYFTNKRLLLYYLGEHSEHFTEIPYENIVGVDFSEYRNDSAITIGFSLIILGVGIHFFIEIIEGFLSGLLNKDIYFNIIVPLWIRVVSIIIGIIFLFVGEQKKFNLVFHFKNREPLTLECEDSSILEDIFKTQRDYRGKIELNK